MTDTPETLQAALKDLEARVAAFEKAQKRAEEEEPLCRNGFYLLLCDIQQGRNVGISTKNRAMREWDRMDRELARLKEGLKPQVDDECDENVDYWANDPRHRTDREYGVIRAHSFAREIQRHRALVGGGK